jgi:Resolvase, N terminal domain
MTKAAIYIYTYHDLPPELVAKLGEPKVHPLDVQERACRAYCERMGYTAFAVYRATAKPPEGVAARYVLQASLSLDKHGKQDEPADWRWVLQYDTQGTRHPYYHVLNLLYSGIIDVIVEFIGRGPSGSAWSGAPEEVSKHLRRMENASLWEIEPPTEQERQLYELSRQAEDAENDEELAALLAQMRTLSAEIKAMRAAHEAEAEAKTKAEGGKAEMAPKMAEPRAKQHHIRAVVYCRASGHNDPSIAQQAAACRTLCEGRGFTVVGTYEDTESTDATKAALADVMLPGVQEAIDFIESGRADVLVVYSPDRIVAHRNALDAELARLPLVKFAMPWQDRS